MFKLAENRDSNRGLYCGPEGLYLGPAPLIEHCDGTYRVRSEEEIAALLAAAYEPAPDLANQVSGLRRVVVALQEGNLSRAMISALYLRLVELSEDGIARLAQDRSLAESQFQPSSAT